MNILELCLSPDLGGLELYVYRASMKLATTDNVCAVISEKGKLAERFSDKNIPLYYFKKPFKLLPVFSALRLARLIDKDDIDALHIHWGRDLSLASLAKWFSKKKPRLIYTRQMQITRNKDDFYHRFIYSQIDVFITITQKLAELARSFLSDTDKHKVVPLYYGVQEPDKILSTAEKHQFRMDMGFADTDFIVALFGRIEEFKGQHVLIDTIAALNKKGTDVKCLIVGHAMDQMYLDTIKNSVKNNAIEKNVYFMDFVENPQDWMQACDLVLLTTKEETFGLVLAEAMHAGVAVIGTNSGGVPEIIEHGKTGLMFEFGDVNELCEHIVQMKNNPEQRKTFANAGQEKAKRLFDIEQHYAKLRKLLSGSNT